MRDSLLLQLVVLMVQTLNVDEVGSLQGLHQHALHVDIRLLLQNVAFEGGEDDDGDSDDELGVLRDDNFQHLWDNNNRVGGQGLVVAAGLVDVDVDVAQIDQPWAFDAVDAGPIPLKHIVEVVDNDATDCNLVGEMIQVLCLLSRGLPRQKQRMMRLYWFYHANHYIVLFCSDSVQA